MVAQQSSFIVFSDDWGEHPSSCQHIFRNIPDEYRVLWVNTIGMRNPTLTIGDVKKIFFKSLRMFRGLFENRREVDLPTNFYVIQPPQLPFSNIPLIRWINRTLVCSSLKKYVAAMEITSPIIVATAPNACDYIGQLGEEKVVYYCVDDFTEWPGLEKELVRSMEEELIRKTDVFIATSDELYEKLSTGGKEVHLLTHGVDYKFFRKKVDQEHYLLQDIPKPRVGYFGLFDKRSDQDLIVGLADRMPDISFVITGNVEVDTSRLKEKKNIFFTGSIPYSELPDMACGWEVCILPYRINKLTDAIQPLKLKEYLATGKPVISTPIKEAVKLSPYLMIARASQEWEKGIRDNIHGTSPELKDKIQLFLQKESWGSKTESFFKICLEG